MIRPSFSIVPLTLALLSSHAPSASADDFVVRNDGGSRVQFTSDAPLETITGVTSGLAGEVTLDPQNVASLRGSVRMTVATLRTGVDLRDEHLRGDSWLDATRHPEATFSVTRVDGSGALAVGEAREVQVHGRLTLHGVTRDVVASARLRRLAVDGGGEALRVRATFTIRLTDFGVSVPAPVRLKVSNELELNVDLRAVRP